MLIFDLPPFKPSRRVRDILVSGRIMHTGEDPQQLLERVVRALFTLEDGLGIDLRDTQRAAEEFAELIVDGYLMPGMPTVMNAGHHRALSSCVVAPVDLRKRTVAEDMIVSYYRQNMGSGFDFTEYEDPVGLLNWLNGLSAQETATGQYTRFIGNMGTLHVSHPRIREFVDAKRQNEGISHFNISIDVPEDFINKAENGETFVLADGSEISAADLLQRMAENAWHTGDPGLMFLDRMNRDNPIAELSRYIATPPCGEMGLAPGETCQFGYINLAKFVGFDADGTVRFDYSKLEAVVQLLTRALDNAIEYSVPYFPTSQSRDVSLMKRKIGIGVCGMADMLIAHGLAYDSREARNLARDILSFVNFISKRTSVVLAEQRGSCLAMNYQSGNRYVTGSFLETKYGRKPTRTVSATDWWQLAKTIRDTGNLRNILTTALPPTYRASLLMSTSPSIEPLLNIFESEGVIRSSIISFLSRVLGRTRLLKQALRQARKAGSFQDIAILSSGVRRILRTATEISVRGHIQMVADLAGINGVFDESASKTVNLPKWATISDIREVFILAHRLGLKCISVYRDGSRPDQPEKT